MTLEELKILITADTTKAKAPIDKLKTDLSNLQKDANINVSGSTSGFIASVKRAFQSGDFRSIGRNIADSITTGLTQGLSQAIAPSGLSALREGIQGSSVASIRLIKSMFAVMKSDFKGFGDYIKGFKEGLGGSWASLFSGPKSFSTLKQVFRDNKEAFKDMMSGIAFNSKEIISSLAGIISKLVSMIPILAAIAAVLAPILLVLGAIAIGTMFDKLSDAAVKFDSGLKGVNRTLGESGDLLQDWLDKSAMSLGMSASVAQAAAAQLAILTRSFTQSTKDNAVATANLLSAAAVVASKTGRTTQDVLERFRSGMLGNTESIEDLGIQVGQKTIEQSEAFRKLGTSFQNLTTQQKQYLYYQAIIEQTTANYGTSVAGGPALVSAQWKAALDNLKLALSQAFLPIATVVLPLLTKFIIYVTATIRVIAWLIRTLLTGWGLLGGGSSNISETMKTASVGAGGVSDNLASAAKSAKEIRKSLAGFDEINNLGPQPSAAAGSGGGGVSAGGGGGFGDIGEMPDILGDMPNVEEILKQWKDELLDFYEAWVEFWGNVGKQVGIAYFAVSSNVKAIINLIKSNFSALGRFFKTVWDNIKAVFTGQITPARFFKNMFGAAWTLIKTIFGNVKTFFRTVWINIQTAFPGVANWFKTQFQNAWNAIKAVFAPYASFFQGMWNGIKNIFSDIGVRLGTALSTAVKRAINTIFNSIETKFNGFIRLLNGLIRVLNKIPGAPYISPVSTLHIPRLATGGIVSAGTPFIAGEAGREAIVPLDRNTEWADAIANTLINKLGNGTMGNDRPLIINLKVNETTFGRVACNSINSLIKTNGVVPLNI